MLTVRIGQLTVEGLSPSKIRSLVGCSCKGMGSAPGDSEEVKGGF